MNRNATSHFDSFDPEVIEAARDVASRAGVPLEAWIASVVPQHLAPVSGATEQLFAGEHGRMPLDQAHGSGSESLKALMARLDGLDQSVEAERRAAALDEHKRPEDIALRVDPVSQEGSARPAAKRGKASAAEMREAVQAIRQRQRELTEQSQPAGSVATMHRDLARRLTTDALAKDENGLPAYVTDELQRNAVRLRDLLAPLASNADVLELENAVESIAANIARAKSDAEAPALALPLAVVRTRIDELNVGETEAAHAQVAIGIKRFKNRLDVATAFEEADADRDLLHALSVELAEIRAAADELAKPARLDAVASRVQSLSEQIDRLPPAEEAQPEPVVSEEPAQKIELADEISALAERVDSLSARADFDADARRQQAAPATSGEMASIQAMLQSLAEKVDRVGQRNGADGLDALEKQVLTLVDRIEAPSALDPALTSLERTMNDLMHQVEALREVAPSDAVIERAARQAVAETLQGASVKADPTEFGLLRASLAEMQARQIASDERLSSTLEGVQSALDRLVNRLISTEAPVAARAPSLDERLMTSTSVEAPRPALRPAQHEEAEPAPVAYSATSVLLEPGSPRPLRAPAVAAEKRQSAPKAPALDQAAASDGDIKTSFIAAARRAAQAAQAELAAETPIDRPQRSRAPQASAPTVGPMTRLRSEIDQHRKPLLLGLAAIVLTLGAIQAVSVNKDDAARVPLLATPPGPTAEKISESVKAAEAPKAPAQQAAPKDPTTTQTVAAPRPPETQDPAKPAVPQVPNMAGLANDLATVPANLAKTKQAALDGDGAAVWDLAVRESDGRGMPRDLAAAAKLFEKLANVGYAPAQYKLGAHYEKGSGVARDLAQAKLWYGRAAEQGHARAMHNLGVIYAENPAANGKPDFVSAASWFRQGAEHGVRDSQYNIAVLYARGLGLTQDLVQSYVWFAAAAAQGDDDAAKKRDDVATKLSAPDLARAKSLAGSFKPRRLDPAVNEPPAVSDAGQGPVSLLGAPVPTAATVSVSRRQI
ncbi:hypothetical protein ACFQE0_00820 [Methylobacterium komagatae]|uniref:Localization factor PodJL n=1 Tax=Methylobacterium komagatae TaxID=374425 RepID=A0ABW2BD32_9HYPH